MGDARPVVGRIQYINCYPVYGAIDRGIRPLDARIVSGIPSELNRAMAAGTLDVNAYRLYTARSGSLDDGILELRCSPGVRAYSFTFG